MVVYICSFGIYYALFVYMGFWESFLLGIFVFCVRLVWVAGLEIGDLFYFFRFCCFLFVYFLRDDEVLMVER